MKTFVIVDVERQVSPVKTLVICTLASAEYSNIQCKHALMKINIKNCIRWPNY